MEQGFLTQANVIICPSVSEEAYTDNGVEFRFVPECELIIHVGENSGSVSAIGVLALKMLLLAVTYCPFINLVLYIILSIL